jgi:DNA-binding CsgD family transcriptional regulator
MPNAQNSTHTLNYLASIHYATQVEDVGELCRVLKSQYGLSGMMLQRLHFDGLVFSQPACRCFGSYVGYRSEYIEEAIYAEDPLLAAGLEYGIEFNWDKAYALEGRFAPAKAIRRQLREAGMLSGVSCVQRSTDFKNTVVAVHLATGNEHLNREQANVFENIAPYLMRLTEYDWITDGPKISLRQLDIVRQLNNGMSARQTANALNLPLRAVNFHLNRISDSLKVDGIDQAIALLDAHSVF